MDTFIDLMFRAEWTWVIFFTAMALLLSLQDFIQQDPDELYPDLGL